MSAGITQAVPIDNTSEVRAIYDPNNLLDFLIEKLKLKNDAALSSVLEVAPPIISKIRRRHLSVGASLLIRMHEVSDLAIVELRALMGDHRAKFYIGDEPLRKFFKDYRESILWEI